MKNTIKTEIIEKFMIENKLSKAKFCKMCKISPNTLNKIITNDDNFGIIALFKIARVLKIQVFQLFKWVGVWFEFGYWFVFCVDWYFYLK